MAKKDSVYRGLVTACGLFIILLTLAIGIFLIIRGTNTFTVYRHHVAEFLFSPIWNPKDDFAGGGQVGAAVFIMGSICVCFLALLRRSALPPPYLCRSFRRKSVKRSFGLRSKF